MPPIISLNDENDDYASSEDEDFKPREEGTLQESAGEGSSSESDDGAGIPRKSAPRPKKRSGPAAVGRDARPSSGTVDDAAAGEELDSGDEAIVRKGRRRNLRSGDADLSEPWVKTRARRRQGEVAEARPAAVAGDVTVDVDELWAAMNQNGGLIPPAPLDPPAASPSEPGAQLSSETIHGSGPVNDNGRDMILIERTTNFAGQTQTEKKLVPRSSAEAQLYLSSLSSSNHPQRPSIAAAASHSNHPSWPHPYPPTRPLRKPSRFEPTTLPPPPSTSESLRVPLRAVGMNATTNGSRRAGTGPTTTLNTVEKSRLDWAGFVDRAELKEDLERVGRGKEGYLARMDFLGRVQDREEEGRRR